MSHPFTLEYMMDGEMLGTEVGDAKDQDIQQESKADESKIDAKDSSRMCENKSVIDGSETNSDAGPRDPLEEFREEMNITIPDGEVVSFSRILRLAMRRRMEIFA